MRISLRGVYIFLFIIIAASYLFAGCAQPVEEPSAPVQPDAFAQNAKMARGVNIIGYDPIWGDFEKRRFKTEHFRIIKEGGFSTVRINIHPFRHMDENDNYKLPGRWFQTLDWAVENALANDLMVILDFHEYNAMADDPENKKEIFLSFWRQVAPHCKDLPDNVLFEILNEPNRQLTPEIWNRFLKEALGIIRETNPERTVVIGPGNWNQINFLEKLELPEEDRNIIVTIHYYSPHHFTHQGAPWSAGSDEWLGLTWGTDEDKEAVAADFEKCQAWSQANNRPILLGEFGAYERADIDSRVKYTSFVSQTALAMGWSFTYWQFDSDFIVYDIDKGEWNEPIYRALVPKND
jgi:endoglucanase